MAKSPEQSDFVYVSPARDPDEATAGASPKATRWMYRVVLVLVVVLIALVTIALHIPAGE